LTKVSPTLAARRDVIFVVDDDPGVLKSVGRLLAARGYDPKLFSSAEAFQEHAPLEEGACLVLDIQLGGVSGIELGRALSLSGESIPIVFITGNDSDLTRRAAMDIGCAGYVTKPLSAAVLVDAVTQASRSRREATRGANQASTI
jgi:FixJ family two-component response regulator